MRPNKELFKTYLNSAFNIVSAMDSVDFLLLQEVDFYAREHIIHIRQLVYAGFAAFSSTKAINYNVPLYLFLLIRW